MKLILCTIILLIININFLFADSKPMSTQKQTLGWVEKINLIDYDLIIHAKLDTGADYSSINAENIEVFQKKNELKTVEDWVRFFVKNRYGKKVAIESRIVRKTKIKSTNSKSKERYVIRLAICIGSHFIEEEVSLADRSKFDYQMLVGRSYLAGHIIVDPAITLTQEPVCRRE